MSAPAAHASRPIGRENDLALAARLLQQTRLLTLTGPGGSGKTRLALAIMQDVADRYPDGTAFVPLASVSDPALVTSTIAGALGVTQPGGRSVLDALITFLGERRLLLVLDNFEQIVAAAGIVSRVLDACPGVAALATSRVRLHLSTEQVMPVQPLQIPGEHVDDDLERLGENPCVRLFVTRAQAVDPAFALSTANAASVADICRRLDGLPLAIELAAAQIQLLTPRAISERLDRALPLLTGGPRDAPERQRTMRDTIAWSHDLLDPDERRLLRQLSVFAGGWSLEAAEAVCDDDLNLLRGLASLVDHSLVRRVEQPDGSLRYEMLEAIREYGLEQLAAAGDAGAVGARHASYVLSLASRIEPVWTTTAAKPRAFGRIDADLDNVRAALDWSLRHDPRTAVDIAAVLWEYWWTRGHLIEGSRWLSSVLAAAPDAPSGVRGYALLGACTLASDLGDLEEAMRLADACLPLLEASGGRASVAWALRRKGWAAFFAGDLDTAHHLNSASLDLARELDEPGLISTACGNLAAISQSRGDLDRAVEYGDEAVAVARRSLEPGGHAGGLAIQLSVLGSVLVERREHERADGVLRESMMLALQVGAPSIIVGCLAGFAAIAAGQGQLERSARLSGAREALRESIGEMETGTMNPTASRAIARARELLDDEAWTTVWEQGRTMSLDAAIAYALEPLQPPASAAAPDPSLPGNLTAREIDVLRLVAQGLTDAEVAERLFLARRTINSHLTSIYTKLNVSSRTAAATWAVRNGISDDG